MSEQKKREQWLRVMGWTHDEAKHHPWSHPDFGSGLYAYEAVNNQLGRDADVAIDAMLRLPALEAEKAALEAKLFKIAGLVDMADAGMCDTQHLDRHCVCYPEWDQLRNVCARR